MPASATTTAAAPVPAPGCSSIPGLPLVEALLSAGTGEAVWRWLAPGNTTAALLSAILASDQALSHGLLDEFEPSPTLHRVRAVLTHGGVLPPRAEHLARISPWLEDLLTGQPAAHASLVRAWAHWTLLRRARARLRTRMFTAGAAHGIRSSILAALGLLSWIQDSGTSLAALTPPDLDQRLTTGAAEHLRGAGLHHALKRHGLPHAAQARAAALISLAADLPAPILADLLGLHITTAITWARHARSDWTAYLAARPQTRRARDPAM